MQLRQAPVWQGFVLAALYFVGCVFSALPLQEGSVALLWPAAGVGMAGAVLYGVRHTWFVPLAMLAYHATIGTVPDAIVPSMLLSTENGTNAGWPRNDCCATRPSTRSPGCTTGLRSNGWCARR